MTSKNPKFDKLFNVTNEHLKEKKYLYKPKMYDTYKKDIEIKVGGFVLNKFGKKINKNSCPKYTDKIKVKGFDTKEGTNGQTIYLLKKGDAVIDENGDMIYLNNPATPHKNVMLSIALSMAYKNYETIRGNDNIAKLDSLKVSDMLIRYFSKKFYNKIGDAHTIINENENYKFKALEKFRDIEHLIFGTIKRLRNYHSHYIHEPSILGFEDYFDNKSVLKEDELETAFNWFENLFENAKSHLILSLDTRKKKLENEKKLTETTKERKNELKKKLKEIEETLNTFKKHIHYFYEDDNNIKRITLNGQLFMASLFLYKREMKIVLDKWRHFRLDKDIQGYGNSIHTFFTYYSMSESYSINNYNNNLLKFRNITSKLTTIPASNHPELAFIYEKIRNLNKEPYRKIDKLDVNKENQEIMKLRVILKNLNENEIKITIKKKLSELKKNRSIRPRTPDLRKKSRKLALEIRELKTMNKVFIKERIAELETVIAQKKSIKDVTMPIRKRNILTATLMQYMLDNNLFNENVKIAIAKNMTDRIIYYNQHKDMININESLTALKNRKKKDILSDENTRRVLNEHYKELKRNFHFKTPNELKELTKVITSDNDDNEIIKEPQGYKFAIKKKNAYIKYTLSINNKEFEVNITLSPQLLLKVVFVHLITGKNEFETTVKQFIKGRISKFNIENITAEKLVEIFKKSNSDIPLGKILPKSILQVTNNLNNDAYNEEKRVKESIENTIKNFINFKRENEAVPRYWEYASKKKIDIILEYLNFKVRYDVFSKEGKYYNENNTEGAINKKLRHKNFNVDSHDIARQYFRYFGRYKKGTYAEAQNYGKKDFVMPSQITQLKEDYKDLFSYIENEIDKATSLEELYEAVINKYISDLEELKNQNYDNETLINILKINRNSKLENVEKILKTHYLNNFAISDSVVSIKKSCETEWNAFKLKKEKELTGKEVYFTEYSFIRNYLQELDGVKTNIDYIFQYILPEDKNGNKKKPKLKRQVTNQLLKLKTEELILWNIAKSYWKKANNEKYDLAELPKYKNKERYQVFTTFNKVYKQTLDYTIEIPKAFWSDNNKTKYNIPNDHNILNSDTQIKIKVPAKRYDNVFLKSETKLIKDYILWYHLDTFDSTKKEFILPIDYEYIKNDGKSRIYNLQKFDDLIKVIYTELKKSVSNIGDLLRAERKLITSNAFNVKNALEQKYINEADNSKPIKHFFIEFKREDLLNKFSNDDEMKQNIKFFRNNALHYNLQDPKRKKLVIERLNEINNILCDDEWVNKE